MVNWLASPQKFWTIVSPYSSPMFEKKVSIAEISFKQFNRSLRNLDLMCFRTSKLMQYRTKSIIIIWLPILEPAITTLNKFIFGQLLWISRFDPSLIFFLSRKLPIKIPRHLRSHIKMYQRVKVFMVNTSSQTWKSNSNVSNSFPIFHKILPPVQHTLPRTCSARWPPRSLWLFTPALLPWIGIADCDDTLRAVF